jgi:glycosyltransferase involved in cell wall biosynthesis
MVERRPQPIRVGFLIAGLYGGGAERSMLNIIETLDREQFAPSLILFDERFDYIPPEDLPVVVLSRPAWFRTGRFAARIVETARLIARHRIELLVSFLMGPNVVAIAAARLAGIPVIAGERSAPERVLSATHLGRKRAAFWTTLVRATYPRASLVMANTEGARAELLASLRMPAHRIVVMPNPIDIDRVVQLSREPLDPGIEWPDGAVLVHVGRFSYAKDHGTLLRALVRLRSRRPATLVLVGGGEDEQRVRSLCTTLGLDKDVIFTGFTRNPYKYLARATLCVLTSRFEGLPNALIEALALGVPIVSTACPYGPLEILGDNEYGVLTPVGDADAFADAVDALLNDPERMRDLAERGRIRAREYDRRTLGPKYQDLFARVVNRPLAAVT